MYGLIHPINLISVYYGCRYILHQRQLQEFLGAFKPLMTVFPLHRVSEVVDHL